MEIDMKRTHIGSQMAITYGCIGFQKGAMSKFKKVNVPLKLSL